MLLLTATNHLVRLTCSGAGADIRVHASYIDTDAGASTLALQNTPAITSTTPTTIVPSPTGTVKRNVKHLNIRNIHASVGVSVRVEHYDGTTYIELMEVILKAGESLVLGSTGKWRHTDVNGAEYSRALPELLSLSMAETLAETLPREVCTETNATIPSTSGTLWMQAINLRAGLLISNITLISATTAAVTPTQYIAGLYSYALSKLAETANQTTAAWAANTMKTLALTTPYRVPTSGIYYIGFYMVAATIVKLKAAANRTGGQLGGEAPILGGTSTAGLTTALPATAAAITFGTNMLYSTVG